jgi:hypothetical protein
MLSRFVECFWILLTILPGGRLKMKTHLALLFVPISLFLFSSQVLAESDPIYDKCRDQPRGPWCYEEEVERVGSPDLCENILKYWPKADGVHGWCLYHLAVQKKDCSLCNRIQTQDIRKMCIQDVCKSGE